MKRIFFLPFLLAAILASFTVYYLKAPRLLEVVFFDVGQGDAIFIETPQGQQILIDGGPSAAILEKLVKVMPFWDRTIEVVILTHPEKDHLSGLIEVLKKYQVKNIFWTGVVRQTAEYREWLKTLEREGAKIFIAGAGQKIRLAPDVQIQILYPLESLAGQEFKDSNNTSIVTRLDFGENSFLFTGDVSKSVEKELIQNNANIDVDVLKAGHHGSKTSSSEDFVKIVSPRIAVISSGSSNSYGHPHQEVLDILAKYGITVLRTDLQGDIKITSDGENLKSKR